MGAPARASGRPLFPVVLVSSGGLASKGAHWIGLKCGKPLEPLEPLTPIGCVITAVVSLWLVVARAWLAKGVQGAQGAHQIHAPSLIPLVGIRSSRGG